MRFSRKFAASLAGAVVVPGTVLAAAPALAATPPEGTCYPGVGCTFENANYGGGRINVTYNVKDFDDVGWWVGTQHILTNDAASSAYNNGTTGATATWFKNASYKGTKKTLNKGTGIIDFSSASLNDQVSSACFTGCCN